MTVVCLGVCGSFPRVVLRCFYPAFLLSPFQSSIDVWSAANIHDIAAKVVANAQTFLNPSAVQEILDSDDEVADASTAAGSSSGNKVLSSQVKGGKNGAADKGQTQEGVAKAEKRKSRLTGPAFIGHRNSTFSKMSEALAALEAKMATTKEAARSALEASRSAGPDKALLAYRDSCERALQWLSLWSYDPANVKVEESNGGKSASPTSHAAAVPGDAGDSQGAETGGGGEEAAAAAALESQAPAGGAAASAPSATTGEEAPAVQEAFAVTDHVSLIDSVKAAPTIQQPVLNVMLLRTRPELQQILDNTLTKETIEALDKHQEVWKSFMACAGELHKFSAKATSDMSGFLTQKEASSRKAAEKRKKDLEKAALVLAKQQAKDAARAVAAAEQQVQGLVNVPVENVADRFKESSSRGSYVGEWQQSLRPRLIWPACLHNCARAGVLEASWSG